MMEQIDSYAEIDVGELQSFPKGRANSTVKLYAQIVHIKRIAQKKPDKNFALTEVKGLRGKPINKTFTVDTNSRMVVLRYVF